MARLRAWLPPGRRVAAGLGSAGALVAALADAAPAHPHVLVVYSVALPAGARGIEAIGFVFTFDEPFSALIRYEAQWVEPARAAEHHARTLRQLPHEIAVSYDGVPVPLEEPVDLAVAMDGGQVTFRFRVPLRAPLAPPGTLDISVDDPGLFTAFVLRDPTPVEVEAAAAHPVTCARARAPSGAPGPLRCRYGPGSR